MQPSEAIANDALGMDPDDQPQLTANKAASSESGFTMRIRSDQLDAYGPDGIAAPPVVGPQTRKSPRLALRVSEEQMVILVALEEQKLTERFAETIYREHVELTSDFTPPQLRDFVKRMLLRARFDYGFVLERDFFQYVLLALAMGDGFEKVPTFGWAAELLSNKDLKPGVRMVNVRDGLRAGFDQSAGGASGKRGSDG